MRSIFKSISTTDLRSIALFRICVGFLSLVDLLDRLPDIRTHYSDFGVLPRFAMLQSLDDGRLLGLHLFSGATGFQLFLFALHFLCAFALLIGYRTRIATALTWAFALSLAGRQPQVTYAADGLLRLLLMWGIFLPLGARWSVDRTLNRVEPRGSNRYSSVAVFGLLVQIASVYIFTAIQKDHELPWRNGLGVYYAVMLEAYATPIGAWISHFPEFLRLSNYGVLAFEGFAAFALFIPWRNNFVRLPLFFAFLFFHIGMGLGLYVTLFQSVAIAGWTSTLPSSFWILLQRRFKRATRRLFVLRKRIAQSIRRDYAPRLTRLRVNPGKTLNALLVLGVVHSVLWNSFITWPGKVPMPPMLFNLTFALGLDQTWGMFAKPFRRSGWFVIPAKLANGTDVDLFQGGAPLKWDKPANISAMYRDERNRKFMLNLLEDNRDPSKLALGNYFCRAWNADHPDASQQLEAFKIIYRRGDILLDGRIGVIESEFLWQHQCHDGLLDKWGSKIATGP